MEKIQAAISILLGVILVMSGIALADVPVPVIEPPLKAAPLKSGPPVGFVTYMGGSADKYLDMGLNESPATADLACVFSWRMKSHGDKLQEQIVDFNFPTGWLKKIYQSGRTAYPILDTSLTNSHYSEGESGGWRSNLTKKAGQNIVNLDGMVVDFSSLHSPIFRESVFNYIDQLIDWVKINDKEHRIPAYLDGVEWFYPGGLDYSPLAFDAFRIWLKNKYSGISELNKAWGSDFGDWKNIGPVRTTQLGDHYVGQKTFGFWGDMQYFWVSESVDVEQGREYRISAKTLLKNVHAGLGLLEFVWFDKLDRRMLNQGEHFPLSQPNKKWLESSTIMQAPKNAARVRFAIQLCGPGTIKFKNPSLQRWPSGEELLPLNSLSSDGGKTGWKFGKVVIANQTQDDWSDLAGARVKTWIEDVNNSEKISGQITQIENNPAEPIFTIAVQRPPLPLKNTGVAYDDWVVFSMESMAEWSNTCAKHIKQRDPSRLVSSWLSFAWAINSLWNFGTYMQRADISLANTPDIEINGLQMCIGGNDFTYATCTLDLARKYGKPMMATDYVDFTYGVYSGFETHYRGALAAVQHGMGGMFVTLWYNPGVMSYSFYTGMPKWERDRLVADTKSAIGAVSGYKLQTKVAFFEPIMSYSFADEDGYKGDEIDSGGLYHLILDLGLIPDIITPYEISKQGGDILKKYDLIFLSDCPVLDNKVNQAVIDYVKNGGILIGSGRFPMKDFAANSLKTKLLVEKNIPTDVSPIKALANPIIETIGKGKIYWIADKLGKSYWGKVRRLHKESNTPAIYLRLDYSSDAESLRRYVRQSMSSLIDSTGIKQPAKIDPSDGAINLAVYQKPSSAQMLLFLVHTGKGRSHGVPVKIDSSLKFTKGQAWIDFDRKENISVNDSGILLVPDFSYSCIVSLIE